jgi:hypothetical protein
VEHVLFQYHVASSAVPASQRGRSIANWAAHDYPGSFLFAWYFIGDGHTPNTLRVLRYDRRTGIASNTVLTDSPATRASFLGQFPVPCMGSSASVAEREGTIYVETHLTPSASCTLVLDHHLTLKTALSGWLLGFVSDRYAVFRESMIHFAPTHPMNISVYDAVTGRSTRVYPLPGDRLRAEYVRSLDAHLPSRSWCRINNKPCRASDFTSDVQIGGHDSSLLQTNDGARAFGFKAEFMPEGFGPAAQAAVGNRIVDYVFLLRGGRWVSRDYTPTELQTRFKATTLSAYVRSIPAL